MVIRLLASVILALILSTPTHGEDAPAFRVISDKSLPDGTREVFVELEAPLPDADVRRIADSLKAIRDEGPPKTRLWFLLPGMPPGAGAWARVVYQPEFTLSILGVNADDSKKLLAKAVPIGSVIGSWLYNLPGAPHTMTIVRRKGGVFLCTAFQDGSKGEREMKELVPNKRFAEKDSRWGDYWQINSDGHLELWSGTDNIRGAVATKIEAIRPAVPKDKIEEPIEQRIERLRVEIAQLEVEKRHSAKQDDRESVRRLAALLRTAKTSLNREMRAHKAEAASP